METPMYLSGSVRRSLALATVLAAGTAMLYAQSTATNLSNQAAAQDAAYSSSSSSTGSVDAFGVPTETASVTSPFNFTAPALNAQYGGNARYGRPRYRGGNTNEDGSAKWVAYVGGGFTVPTGPTHITNTDSWSVQGGFGRNYNKHFGVAVEFDWDNFGLTKGILDNQENLYNNQLTYYCGLPANASACTSAGVTAVSGIDGYSHDWSFSLQPIYHLTAGDTWGTYVTGGVGFYHKISTFTEPGVGEYCDPFYGCFEYEANQPIDSYTSNAPGLDAGFGVTYKFSHFSNEEFYGEARYVYTFNQYRSGVNAAYCTGDTSGTCVADTINEANDYPQNSWHTSYIPVRFGIRF